MPLRSPKMYFCILGFQRLVWWPKCTPASSSSFMVSAAISLSSFGWPPITSGRARFAPALSRKFIQLSPRRARPLTGLGHVSARTAFGHRSSRSCELTACCSGRVFAVQAHVLLAQVRCPHAVLTAAEAEIDPHRVLGLRHEGPDLLEASPTPEHSLLDQYLVAESDGHSVLRHPRRRLTERHHDTPPVRIGAIDGCLDERRVRHRASGQEGLTPRPRPAHRHLDYLGGAFTVGHQHPGQACRHGLESARELAQPA